MFDRLTDRLTHAFSGLQGKGKLTEADVSAALRDIRTALLEADVALPVAKSFAARLKERALGEEIHAALDPSQQMVKIVQEELTALLGGETRALRFNKNGPTVIMLAGLQGVGKTTFAAKLALRLKEERHTPLLVAADLQRPNAVGQLRVNGERIGVPVFAPEEGNGVGDPVTVALAGVAAAKQRLHDVVIIDTAGRLGVDTDLMQQARAIREAVNPDEVLYVGDAMMGQSAAETAVLFHEALAYDGVVLTKLDGDARGGAALSIRELTGKPIMFVGVGEGMEDIETFHPDRMAERILDMGDVLTLIEKAERVFDHDEAERTAKKIERGEFNLADFLQQLDQVRKLGSMSKVLAMMPGLGAMREQIANINERDIDRQRAIILSMTPQERRDPKLLDSSRKARIASGAGMPIASVNRLLEGFETAAEMMRGGGPQMGPNGQLQAPGRNPGNRVPAQRKKGKGARRSGNPANR